MRRTGGERIEVTGVVQGVGFRPFVHRLAIETGLDGFVGNDPTRVFIEVTGPSPASTSSPGVSLPRHRRSRRSSR